MFLSHENEMSSNIKENCEEFSCRVQKHNSNETYSIQTFWFNDKATINVWDKVSLWSGQVTTEALRDFSSMLAIDYDEYLLECKRVLTKNGGDPQFVYAIENSCFVWKKIDPENNIKVKFGSVGVRSVPLTEEGIAILDSSFNCVLHLSDVLRIEEERKFKCDEEMKSLKQKLIRLCEEKESLEKELYAKFLAILNQKKKRIRSLEECFEQGSPPNKKRLIVMSSDSKSDVDDPDSKSDVDDPSSWPCDASAAQSSKQQRRAAPEKMDRQRKQKFRDVRLMPLDPKLSFPQCSANSHGNHYDSDTDVDTTSDEEKPTFDLVSSEPNLVATNDADCDLFSDMSSPPAVLPKRNKLSVVQEAATAVYFTKSTVKKLPALQETPRVSTSNICNTLDLLEDLHND